MKVSKPLSDMRLEHPAGWICARIIIIIIIIII